MLDIGQNLQISRFCSKRSKNLDFGQNFRKISILVKIVGDSQFWSKLTKMLISDKIAKNADYSRNFRKISILVDIYENLDFGQS